ncbi:dienelactone hydrolase family protein [Streptomyces sp. NY05-11A]|uniref:dienelactone hydrolase family protein n=1 Tax=Streptomyces soliscabiei TaxID=588897 RepID=UPI0029B562EC|nr:dienelactone hydrolase family protein [Streptomyces sp. NY05-11A]MDX2675077.1 dienelactone hydrolase family protein [Streptomyces sp. NY05-11A]
MDIAFPRIEPTIERASFSRGSGRSLPVARIELGGVPRGTVIVLCDAGGLERDAAGIMSGLAEHGYESLAVDLSSTEVISDREVLGDVAVLLGRFGERGWSPEQMGLVGYGVGARAALLAAAEFELGAAVSVAPSGPPGTPADAPPSLSRAARPVRTPWLGLFGQEDPGARPEALDLLREHLRDSPAYTQVVTYPGVARDFYRDARETLAHAATFDAWQRTLEWLELRVVPRPTPLAEEWQKRVMSAART